jgi:hypothetical protein
MLTKYRALTAVLAAIGLTNLTCLNTGCAGSGADGSVTMQDALNALEEAQFKGRFHFQSSGHPFAIGNQSFLGAPTAVFAEGDVNFTEEQDGE